MYAAQAWHWVHGADRYEQARRACSRPAASVALFWNDGPPAPRAVQDRQRRDLRAIVAARDADSATTDWQLDFVIDEFAAVRSFEPVVKRVVTWETSYTSAEWMRLLGRTRTTACSPTTCARNCTPRSARSIDAHGGTLPVVYDTLLYLARRL